MFCSSHLFTDLPLPPPAHVICGRSLSNVITSEGAQPGRAYNAQFIFIGGMSAYLYNKAAAAPHRHFIAGVQVLK